MAKSGDIRFIKGFICPNCHTALPTAEHLQTHYQICPVIRKGKKTRRVRKIRRANTTQSPRKTLKMTNAFKVWAARRISMSNTTVQYSSSVLGLDGGSFDLEGALLTDSEKSENDFDVYTKDKKKHSFRASSLEEKQSWMNDFKAAMDTAKRSATRDADWFFSYKQREDLSIRYFMGGMERFRKVVGLIIMFPKLRKPPAPKSRRFGRRVTAKDLSTLLLPQLKKTDGDGGAAVAVAATAASSAEADHTPNATTKIKHKVSFAKSERKGSPTKIKHQVSFAKSKHKASVSTAEEKTEGKIGRYLSAVNYNTEDLDFGDSLGPAAVESSSAAAGVDKSSAEAKKSTVDDVVKPTSASASSAEGGDKLQQRGHPPPLPPGRATGAPAAAAAAAAADSNHDDNDHDDSDLLLTDCQDVHVIATRNSPSGAGSSKSLFSLQSASPMFSPQTPSTRVSPETASTAMSPMSTSTLSSSPESASAASAAASSPGKKSAGESFCDFPEYEFSPKKDPEIQTNSAAPPATTRARGEFCLQFRVLTRGKYGHVMKLLKELCLGPYVHSVWDMTGCGVSPFGEEYLIDRDAHASDNKLAYVDHWARSYGAREVIFVEDVNETDAESYKDWQHANPSPPYDLDILKLPYESAGVAEVHCQELKRRVTACKKAQRKLLLVMDFDCTITSTHFYKTLFWPSSRYAKRLKQWMHENMNDKDEA